MRSIQTGMSLPLASVKPLDGLMRYRAYCLEQTRFALRDGIRQRERSPVTGGPLVPFGEIEGLSYVRCPESGSLFLASVADPQTWRELLSSVSMYRHSPEAFHFGIADLRQETVYTPKLGWIEETLRLQGVRRPRLLEVVTLPSDMGSLLRASGLFTDVVTVEEMLLASGRAPMPDEEPVQTAVLLESLDRVDDPAALVQAVVDRLSPGGLLFVTGLVASGFDLATLGIRNRYLYPPDRTNCFSLRGLTALLAASRLSLLEVSTPGMLDVQIVQAHLEQDPRLGVSPFERQLLESEEDTHRAFQTFLQQQRLSSFTRIVARKEGGASA